MQANLEKINFKKYVVNKNSTNKKQDLNLTIILLLMMILVQY